MQESFVNTPFKRVELLVRLNDEDSRVYIVPSGGIFGGYALSLSIVNKLQFEILTGDLNGTVLYQSTDFTPDPAATYRLVWTHDGDETHSCHVYDTVDPGTTVASFSDFQDDTTTTLISLSLKFVSTGVNFSDSKNPWIDDLSVTEYW